VSQRPFETASIDGLRREDGWSPIRRSLDVRSFGVNAWTAKQAGDQLVSQHDEVPSGHEELYLITSGRATFTVDGEEVEAAAGTIVFVRDPATSRGAVAREAGTTVLAIGGKPGEVYARRDWEIYADVFPLFDRGEFATAKQLLLEALDQAAERSTLYFNLACAEAQLGDVDAALDYLGQAIELRPSLAEGAPDDHDLEPLRGDPRFAALVGRQGS
jgi:tetratricopeptide (TPR) repeat protein